MAKLETVYKMFVNGPLTGGWTQICSSQSYEDVKEAYDEWVAAHADKIDLRLVKHDRGGASGQSRILEQCQRANSQVLDYEVESVLRVYCHQLADAVNKHIQKIPGGLLFIDYGRFHELASDILRNLVTSVVRLPHTTTADLKKDFDITHLQNENEQLRAQLAAQDLVGLKMRAESWSQVFSVLLECGMPLAKSGPGVDDAVQHIRRLRDMARLKINANTWEPVDHLLRAVLKRGLEILDTLRKEESKS